MVVKKEVIAGATIEVSTYHVNHIPKGARAKKKEKSPERIKQSNIRHRTDRLRQLMNANFEDKKFWSLTLTYAISPKTIRQVRDDASDFVRRLRKTAEAFGVELKFIYVIGAGKHRRHIHITVNGLPDMAMVTGCWIHGHVSMTPLYSKGQYRDLADYYIKNAIETREQEEALGEKPGQWYVPSRNLTQPTETKTVLFGRFKTEPETKPGYYLEKESVYAGITSMGFPLLRYTLIKEKEHEGDTSVHLHGCGGQLRRQGKGVISALIRERRSRERITDRPYGDRRQSESRHAGSNDGCARADQRRERDTRHRNMPLSRSDSKHQSGLIQKMASKWLEKLKRR